MRGFCYDPRMNISLTPELERRIAEKVDSGLYGTASEVVREALRRLFDAEEERGRLIAKLNAELEEGIAELERGEGIDGEEAFRQITETIERRRRLR
jgi:antitoxin ParD1/3/4